MTINDMALVAGVSTETVRAKGKEMYPDRFINGKKTVFNQSEAITIMAELRKRGFVKPTENLEVPTENLEVTRIDRLENMVEKLCLAVVSITQAIAQPQKKETMSIEAPQIDLRAQLRQVMNIAARSSGDYAGAWNLLYNEIYYRLHINVKERAKNADCKPLDILEAENQLSNAVLIAREIFK